MLRRGFRVLFFVGLVSILLVGCGTDEFEDLTVVEPAAPIPPVATFVIGPEDGAVWTEFTLDASGTTDEDGSISALQYRWDWNGDGTWDQDWLSSPVTTHTFAAAGVFDVTLEVRDNDGKLDTFVRTLKVTAGPLGIFSVDNRVIQIDESFTFDAHGSEVADGAEITAWEWDWGMDGTFVMGDTVMVRQYPEYGNYGVVLRLTDSDGHVDTDTLFVAVVDQDNYVVPPMIEVPMGPFHMGSPADMLGTELNETPVHEVLLTRGFFMGETEVTNQQYIEMAQWALAQDPPLVVCDGETLLNEPGDDTVTKLLLLDLADPGCEIAFADGVFMLRDAGHGINPDHPVKQVSWFGAAAYCNWLSAADPDHTMDAAYEEDAGWAMHNGNAYSVNGYRLPAEAEWERACRADTDTLSAFHGGVISDVGCDEPVLADIAVYCGNSAGWTEAVDAKTPNAWGFYGMHGNLWEWCTDWSRGDYYANSQYGDPWGPATGSNKIIRGGYWNSTAADCRSANRFNASPEYCGDAIGFRVVRMP